MSVSFAIRIVYTVREYDWLLCNQRPSLGFRQLRLCNGQLLICHLALSLTAAGELLGRVCIPPQDAQVVEQEQSGQQIHSNWPQISKTERLAVDMLERKPNSDVRQNEAHEPAPIASQEVLHRCVPHESVDLGTILFT